MSPPYATTPLMLLAWPVARRRSLLVLKDNPKLAGILRGRLDKWLNKVSARMPQKRAGQTGKSGRG